MVNDKIFAVGLAKLALAFNRDQTNELADLYFSAVGSKLSGPEWEAAVAGAISNEEFFPSPAKLLRYGRPQNLTASGARVYDAILASYEAGQTISPREVRSRYGQAAFDAFVACGGSRAFEWCEPASVPFRLKAFIEAWKETAISDGRLALPDGYPQAQLPE